MLHPAGHTGACMWCTLPHSRPPSAQEAFIFNYASHWFAVRKLCGVWFNLDSCKKRPEVLVYTCVCVVQPGQL
jgi:hypothetical protein